MDYDTVLRAAARSGLTPRGGFHPQAADGVPPLRDGRAAATLVLLGNAGAALWRSFGASPEAADGAADALDRWSRRVIGGLAERLGATPLFPFDGPPWLPFVRWAKRAGPVAESPLGMLVHPDYGLWHAWRGALAFPERLALPPRDARPPPCLACAEQPCLGACPAGAFGPRGYDVAACTAHLSSEAGGECMRGGCLARRACPVGSEYAYADAQAAFHMRAFLAARG